VLTPAATARRTQSLDVAELQQRVGSRSSVHSATRSGPVAEHGLDQGGEVAGRGALRMKIHMPCDVSLRLFELRVTRGWIGLDACGEVGIELPANNAPGAVAIDPLVAGGRDLGEDLWVAT